MKTNNHSALYESSCRRPNNRAVMTVLTYSARSTPPVVIQFVAASFNLHHYSSNSSEHIKYCKSQSIWSSTMMYIKSAYVSVNSTGSLLQPMFRRADSNYKNFDVFVYLMNSWRLVAHIFSIINIFRTLFLVIQRWNAISNYCVNHLHPQADLSPRSKCMLDVLRATMDPLGLIWSLLVQVWQCFGRSMFR